MKRDSSMTAFTRMLVATATALTFSSMAAAQQADPSECEQKRAGVTAEVEEAKAAGQTDRVRGLERALAEIKVSCTEPGQKAKRDRRVSQKEKDVTKRQHELEEAQRDGNADKIAKRQAKLKEAQDELAAARKK
ncbi:MAG: DUF1090 domain-containing protein [Comamonadaceae bacterium]|nr:MAG: DUF1090 domain-containing protein [Comamonadaceae bacterium]